MKREGMGLRLALAVLSLCVLAVGCSMPVDTPSETSAGISETATSDDVGSSVAPFSEPVEGLEDVTGPADFDWRQYEGIHLNFICEVNNSATVLAREAEQFTKATGIRVTIQALDFNTLVERINLDFVSKTARFQVLYVDPYKTLIPFSDRLVDLNELNEDPSLPHLPGDTDDFFHSQLDVDSYFLDREHLYALPFDAPTMILFYRSDILDKYGPAFERDTGISARPGDEDFTWEAYLALSTWLTEHVPKNEVLYGSGHQAKRHNSLFCDFSNVLAAYGGTYFKNPNIGSIGAAVPQNSVFNSGKSVSALSMYKRLVQAADPRSLSWDWFALAEAFRNGDIAMMPNWNEYATMMESSEQSVVSDKVGYSLLPSGPVQSANIFGGSGIGINGDAPRREQEAAWLFLLWATSPQTELMILKHPDGGDVPLRKSIYALDEVKLAMTGAGVDGIPSMKPIQSVLQAWEDEYTYQRPKVPRWPQIEEAIIDEIYTMLTEDGMPVDAAENITWRIDAITAHPGGVTP